MVFNKALVTGGAGFIGSHIVDRLLEDGLDVSVLDDLSTGNKRNIERHIVSRSISFIEADIRDSTAVRKAVKDVDVVFHEAALVSVTRSVEDPLRTNDVNVTGTLNLLEASCEMGVKRFIYASSSSVYGESQTLPKKETMKTLPISPYATSKLAAENYCQVFYHVKDLETVCLRYFNVYGPRQTSGPYSGVITNFINRVLNGEPPIIYGDGKQTRDFTNVEDVVEANVLASKSKSAIGEVFNIATGKQMSINQLVQKTLKIMDKENLKPRHVSPRSGDIRHSYADIGKAEKILGYKPTVKIENGLHSLVKWWKKNKEEEV